LCLASNNRSCRRAGQRSLCNGSGRRTT
jgi:hypothetical protein